MPRGACRVSREEESRASARRSSGSRGRYRPRALPPITVVRSEEYLDDAQRAELAQLFRRLLLQQIRDGQIEQV